MSMKKKIVKKKNHNYKHQENSSQEMLNIFNYCFDDTAYHYLWSRWTAMQWNMELLSETYNAVLNSCTAKDRVNELYNPNAWMAHLAEISGTANVAALKEHKALLEKFFAPIDSVKYEDLVRMFYSDRMAIAWRVAGRSYVAKGIKKIPGATFDSDLDTINRQMVFLLNFYGQQHGYEIAYMC